jgi:predicted enzyme related to lactoylglutathione lyase
LFHTAEATGSKPVPAIDQGRSGLTTTPSRPPARCRAGGRPWSDVGPARTARRYGGIASAKRLSRGAGKDAGQAHWLGGHQDKRVPRHGGTPSSSPRTDRQPRGVRLRRLPATGGRHVRGVRSRRPGPRAFSTGPVVGFVVDDLTAAVRELEAAGIELLGGEVDERGGGWRHFRAPDGNVYELTSG